MKSLVIACVGALASLAFSSAAFSADCNSGNTADLNACAASSLKKVDTELNSAYNAYRGQLSSEQQKQLKVVQLAWIRFRDAACEFESSGVKGGSAYQMVYTDCLAAKTSVRLKEIQTLAACKEGDLSCPAWK